MICKESYIIIYILHWHVLLCSLLYYDEGPRIRFIFNFGLSFSRLWQRKKKGRVASARLLFVLSFAFARWISCLPGLRLLPNNHSKREARLSGTHREACLPVEGWM